MGRETLGEVQDESGDPTRGPGRVGGPSGRSGTSWGTLPDVQDWLKKPRRGPRRVRKPFRRTHGEVRDGSGDSRGGRRRVGGPSVRSGMVRGNLGEDRD